MQRFKTWKYVIFYTQPTHSWMIHINQSYIRGNVIGERGQTSSSHGSFHKLSVPVLPICATLHS